MKLPHWRATRILSHVSALPVLAACGCGRAERQVSATGTDRRHEPEGQGRSDSRIGV